MLTAAHWLASQLEHLDEPEEDPRGNRTWSLLPGQLPDEALADLRIVSATPSRTVWGSARHRALLTVGETGARITLFATLEEARSAADRARAEGREHGPERVRGEDDGRGGR